MPRRITVPDDHVGLILPGKTADELMRFMRTHRQTAQRIASRTKDETRDVAQAEANFAGDVMLALLEAKES
jgi:hypothetical protein